MANDENLILFKKGQTGNKNGRPRKLVSHINKELSDLGYEVCRMNDIKDAYLTLINLPLSEVSKIAAKDTDDYPILYKLVAKELTGKRGMEMLDRLLDRAIGKAQTKVDVTSDGNEIKQTPTIINLGSGIKPE